VKIPSSWQSDLADIVVWCAAAFLLLALVNGLKKVVPLERPPDPTYVMNGRRR
jgi:hypothetical protein